MIITLTTDFGLTDTYVGQMKGVIAQLAPDATVIDLTHGIGPQQIMAGAMAMETVVGVFGMDAIHVGVVDPGVGTKRKAVAIETDQGIFIGPDNGLFTLVLERAGFRRAVELNCADYHRGPVSATFHGRDIFAPAAGHLAAGVDFAALGSPIAELVALELPRVKWAERTCEAHVLYIDHFGNLITSVTQECLRNWLGDKERQNVQVKIGKIRIRGIHQTFADTASGQPVAYIGSSGRLEIAVRNANAGEVMGVKPGCSITLSCTS